MTSGVEKLANAILLSVAKKPPDAFRIRPDGEAYVVEHLVGGETIEEMRAPNEEIAIPGEVFAAVIRRLSVMASLPMRRKGEVALGYIHIEAGSANYYFEIRVGGHGPGLELRGRLLTEAEYRTVHSPGKSEGPYR